MVIALVAASMALADAAGAQEGSDTRRFTPMREVTVSGIVEVVGDDGVDGCELCEACSDCRGVHVLLATRSGRVEVHLAPAWFLERLWFPSPGEHVTVAGTRLRLSRGHGVAAHEVHAGRTTIRLRDEYGLPLWRRTAIDEPARDHREPALRLFGERVQAYAELHGRLADALPPLTVTNDPSSIVLARRALAGALRAARPTARQGDMFSPDVARVFRRLVAEALAGRHIDRLFMDLYDEDWPLPYGVRPQVNDPYPKGATHAVPPILLQRLPALPANIEYRIVCDDLVLWDVDADLVIDFLPGALGPRMTT
jgi:hypothetical protein